MTATGRNGLLVPLMRPCAPHRRDVWIGNFPPSKRIYFWGLLRVCMALKTLRCCGDSSSPEHFEGHTHPQPPKKLHPLARGVVNYSFKVSAWSARPHVGRSGAISHFCWRRPWLWRLWRQLCYVIRLLKISIKILKLVVYIQCLYVVQYIVKHNIIHALLVVAWTEPELYGGRSPNHFGPMDPGIWGIAGKLLSLWEQFSHCTEAET